MADLFGTTTAGQEVRAHEMRAGRLVARVLTFGAILQDLRLDGRPLTLGAPDLAAYDGGPMRFFGAVIGPVAGRIRGGRGPLGDRTLELDVGAYPDALHCGDVGLHAASWEIAEAAPDRLRLTVEAAPGAGGLPGARRFSATYTLTEDALGLTLAAETDAPTWVNLTHHGYWHLGGPPGLDGHRLTVLADHVIAIDGDTLPTGEVDPVAGTRFDFREGRALAPEDVVDNCFPLSDAERRLTPAGRLVAPDGTVLDIATTATGLQVFTGDGIGTRGHVGHGGAPYPDRPGLALEAQSWPDAPNHPGFPSIRLDPGTPWRRDIVWRFEAGR